MLTTAEYTALSTLDVARHVGRGDLSAHEVVTAALARIAERDAALRAFTDVWAEQALARAADVDERLARGVALPLAGVPIGVKASEGPGSFQNRRLAAAGCVPVGATSVPRTRSGWQTYGHTDRGPTLNPLDPDWSPGGSSAGAAAAVSAGLVPLTTGSDGAGSVRIPAAWCGVVGFKPTNGLLPARDRAGLNSPGVVTRSPREAAAYLDAVLGENPGALRNAPGSAGRPTATWSATLGYADTDPAVEATALRAARQLADAGLLTLVEDRPLLLHDPAPVWTALRSGATPPAEARGAQQANALALHGHFERSDLIVTPTTPHPPHGHDGPGSRMSVALTWAFNISGNPALSLPAGATPQGEPVGLHLVARRFADARLLDMAAHAHDILRRSPPDGLGQLGR
ncbi:amidase [Streptomyces sp. NPDC002004]